jgi:hypothetical protein
VGLLGTLRVGLVVAGLAIVLAIEPCDFFLAVVDAETGESFTDEQ